VPQADILTASVMKEAANSGGLHTSAHQKS
jgi:hypothetical protein